MEKNYTLQEIDKEILCALSWYKLLSEELINKFFLQKQGFKDIGCKRHINALLNNDFIEKISHEKKTESKEYYRLTLKGLKTVKRLYESEEKYEISEEETERVHWGKSAIEIAPRFCAHRNEINRFILGYKEKAINQSRIYIEKTLIDVTEARPDAVIETERCYIFLETDMATENDAMLRTKWREYRNFINSQAFLDCPKPIVILMEICGKINPLRRIRKVGKTIDAEILDRLSDDFACVIGEYNTLLNIALRINKANKETSIKKIFEDHGFQIKRGLVMESNDSESVTGKLYIARTENGKIKINGRTLVEFVVDEYEGLNINIIKNLIYYDNYFAFQSIQYGRGIKYLIVGNDERIMYEDFKEFECLSNKRVYFSTHQRLQTMPFCKALFQMDAQGNISHFTDESFINQEYEKNVKKGVLM